MSTSFFEALTSRSSDLSRDGTFSDNGLLVITISINGKFRQFRRECKYIKLIFIYPAGNSFKRISTPTKYSKNYIWNICSLFLIKYDRFHINTGLFTVRHY